MLALTLGLPEAAASMGGAAVFTPASISPTAWYDPSDAATMFQSGTRASPGLASGIGDPVNLVLDKSGNNRDLVFNAGTAPIRQAGYMDFSGSSLHALFTMAQSFDRVSAIKPSSWAFHAYVYDGGASDAAILWQNSAAPELAIYGGSFVAFTGPAAGTAAVITERFAGVSSRAAMNNGAYVTGDAGTLTSGGLTVGSRADFGGGRAAFSWYGAALGSFSDAQIAQLRTYLGSKCGVTL